MGMYTEVMFRAEVDAEAFDIFTRIKADDFPTDQSHEFFSKPRAEQIFHDGSNYHPGACSFVLERDGYLADVMSVAFRGNLKNYDGEIEAFFDWVRPHVKGSGFIGYSLYEDVEQPTLYYANTDAA